MTIDSSLSCQDAVISNRGASCNSRLRNDKAVIADLNIMTYMYQIVDFSAASDNSIIHGTIIDSRTCTNLAVITIDESDEARQVREDSGEEPGFSIEGEELEKLISALAKIV